MKEHPFPAQWLTFISCLAVVMVLGYVDYITGYEFNFFVFYFLPIAATAWLLSPRKAYAISLLSAAVWFAADWYSHHEYSRTFFAFWNAGIRFVSFLLLSYFLTKIKALLVKERKLSNELQDTLNQVKTLGGLLPICSRCKRIRNDQGYWQQIEMYIAEHSDAQFTHGLCRECADKLLADSGIRRKTTRPDDKPPDEQMRDKLKT